ncbi:MAG: hypothetical protein LAP40_25600 [Acidobacteriia bacterium]|nr:hypothetical protein [Terriglobia bacterium]
MAGNTASADSDAGVTWLSGVVVTFLDKVVFPVLWVGGLLGLLLWVYFTYGRITIRADFRLIVVLIMTVQVIWFSVGLQLVGYKERELVVANFWRESRIPFEQIESVDRVWWYRGRLVRVRFKRPTAFGSMVYYIPKWVMFKTFFSRPEEELRRVVAGPMWDGAGAESLS